MASLRFRALGVGVSLCGPLLSGVADESWWISSSDARWPFPSGSPTSKGTMVVRCRRVRSADGSGRTAKQRNGERTYGPGNCHNCRKPGHFVPECSEPCKLCKKKAEEEARKKGLAPPVSFLLRRECWCVEHHWDSERSRTEYIGRCTRSGFSGHCKNCNRIGHKVFQCKFPCNKPACEGLLRLECLCSKTPDQAVEDKRNKEKKKCQRARENRENALSRTCDSTRQLRPPSTSASAPSPCALHDKDGSASTICWMLPEEKRTDGGMHMWPEAVKESCSECEVTAESETLRVPGPFRSGLDCGSAAPDDGSHRMAAEPAVWELDPKEACRNCGEGTHLHFECQAKCKGCEQRCLAAGARLSAAGEKRLTHDEIVSMGACICKARKLCFEHGAKEYLPRGAPISTHVKVDEGSGTQKLTMCFKVQYPLLVQGASVLFETFRKRADRGPKDFHVVLGRGAVYIHGNRDSEEMRAAILALWIEVEKYLPPSKWTLFRIVDEELWRVAVDGLGDTRRKLCEELGLVAIAWDALKRRVVLFGGESQAFRKRSIARVWEEARKTLPVPIQLDRCIPSQGASRRRDQPTEPVKVEALSPEMEPVEVEASRRSMDKVKVGVDGAGQGRGAYQPTEPVKVEALSPEMERWLASPESERLRGVSSVRHRFTIDPEVRRVPLPPGRDLKPLRVVVG